MTTSMNTIPPRPDLGPPQVVVIPPQRRRIWPIVAAVAGGLIVLGAIGSVIDAPSETTPTTVSPDPISVAPVESAWDYDQAEDLVHQAGALLGLITETSDPSADVQNLNSAADLVDQAALLVGPNDAVRFREMSGHLRAAAGYVSVGDWDAATPEFQAVSRLVDEYENAPEG